MTFIEKMENAEAQKWVLNLKHILKYVLSFFKPFGGGGGTGMRHTSAAPYFNGASKQSLHKPVANFVNMLF